MATFSITIPDAQAPRLVADVATVRGVNISAMTLAQKVAFLKSDLRDYWVGIMTQVEVAAVAQAAADAATATRIADINNNLTVT
jgi:hypothetical protein